MGLQYIALIYCATGNQNYLSLGSNKYRGVRQSSLQILRIAGFSRDSPVFQALSWSVDRKSRFFFQSASIARLTAFIRLSRQAKAL